MTETLHETLPLDQRIGEHISVVRLADVVGMPEELHGLTFVIDRPLRGGERIGVYLDAVTRSKIDLVADHSPYALGIIIAANALRGLDEDA